MFNLHKEMYVFVLLVILCPVVNVLKFYSGHPTRVGFSNGGILGYDAV